MARFDNDGNAICEHDFQGGLCTKCLAPQTPEDQQRAENALANYDSLKNGYSEVLGRYVDEDDARLEAWRSHRRQEA
jgi:hypothetical protein